MRNIKLSFEHPHYIYPFKCNIAPAHNMDIERINNKYVEQSLLSIKKHIILSQEQEKIFNSLSMVFKVQFVNVYNKILIQRKQKDYLGESYQQNYEYFARLSNNRIKMKELLELKHYISRINIKNVSQGLIYQKWLILSIVFYTNFMTIQQISSQDEKLHRQLQLFLGLNLIIDIIIKLINLDQKYNTQFTQLIPTIQDIIINSYLNINNLHLQEYIIINIILLFKNIINYQKNKNQKEENNNNKKEKQINNQENKNNKKQNKKINSLIYWIINFNIDIQSQKQYVPTSNQHTFLQIISRILPKSQNILVIQQCVSFIKLLLKEYCSFAQLLFFITEAMRFELPHTFNLILHKIKIRQIKSSNAMKFHLQIDMGQLFSTTIAPYKLKQFIKFTKVQQKLYNSSIRQVHKALMVLAEDFSKYQKGKITFKRKIDDNGKKGLQIQQRQIINIERLVQQNHQKLKSQEVISLQLFQQNEELIKVNKWLQAKLKQAQSTLSEMVSINVKQNIQSKLKLQTRVIAYKIHLSHPNIHLNHPNTHLNHPNTHVKSHLLLPQSNQILHQNNNNRYRQSITQNRRTSFNIANLNFDMSNIQIPRIDMPRESNRASVSFKQTEINNTQLIFQIANNSIHKNIEQKEKEYSKNHASSFLLPPPPPSLSSLPLGSNNNPLILPPPPSLSGLSMPSIPPPPSLSMIPPPLLLGMPNLLLPQSNNSSPIKKDELNNKPQMKNIGWNIIQQSKLKDSFWSQVSQNPFPLNEKQILLLFSKGQKKYIPLKQKIPLNKTILKPDRIKNIQIILKKNKLTQQQFPIISNAINTYNSQLLNQQFLIGLLNMVPSIKQKQEYITLNNQQQDKWTIADKFLHFTSRIPYYQQKIQSILFKYQFPDSFLNFTIRLDQFINFFTNLKNDLFFHKFLEALLFLGNYLNSNTNKGNAKAFRIQNIQKTYLLISQDKQTSFFDYILEQIYKHQSHLFQWQSLTEKNKNIVSLPILCQDYSYFEKKLFKMNKCILLSEENPFDESASFFLSFYIKAKEEVAVMKKKLQLATVLFKNIKDYYGDKLESEDMIRFILQFRTRVNGWKGKHQRMNNR